MQHTRQYLQFQVMRSLGLGEHFFNKEENQHETPGLFSINIKFQLPHTETALRPQAEITLQLDPRSMVTDSDIASYRRASCPPDVTNMRTAEAHRKGHCDLGVRDPAEATSCADAFERAELPQQRASTDNLPRDKVHRERRPVSGGETLTNQVIPSACGPGDCVKLAFTSPAIPSHHPRQRQPRIAKSVFYLDVMSTGPDATVTRLPIILPGTTDSSFSCNRRLSRSGVRKGTQPRAAQTVRSAKF
ncbi:hypothetical protein EDB83DRAFT_2316716 [Lactarius deliciosus]|nr:hypothetical protein EDB83DRAFT_2316716 [Lactarius deliciosus]